MLKLEGVAVAYGNIRALKGVSLEVREGELVAIIGANGAGKSSLLHAVSGFVPCAAGAVSFTGRPLSGVSPVARVGMGISQCLERRRLFPQMSVLENLEMGAYTRRDKAEIARDIETVFAHFPVLGERRRQLAGTLSGGEQQMAAIGRALMSRPRLFLVDEPSLGLAPLMVEKMFAIIGDIRRRGTTVMLVEQNAWAALEIADRAYVLETGRIALEGTGRELLHNDYVVRAYLGG